jgi:hypothetical protein
MDNKAAQITGQIIERFGGIRPMAAKLGVPATTVQGWKKRGIIPQNRHPDVAAAAARENIVLDPPGLEQTDPAGRISDASTPFEASSIRLRGVIGTAGMLSAILALMALAAAGWIFYLRPLQHRVSLLEARMQAASSDSALVGRVAKLEADMAQKQGDGAKTSEGAPDRIAMLEQQLADIRASSAQSEKLAKQLSDLQIAAGGRELLTQSIRDIQSSTATTQGEVERLSTQVTSIATHLGEVDKALSERRQETLRSEAVVLGVGQLRLLASGSKPFPREISAVRALAGPDAEMAALLDSIQTLAETGVPTLDDLRVSFGHVAAEIVRNGVVGDGNNWWRQALYHLESVISIRRVGEDVTGDSSGAIVARAEAKLEEDDLDGAVAALQALTGASAEVAQPWLQDAQHRLMLNNADSELTRLAIDRLALTHPELPRVAPAQGQTP